MAKIEEKAKVGRPKLADEELIKDSWCRVASCIAIVLVMTVCGIGVLTARTPWQVLTFQKVDNLSGSVAELRDPNTKIIDVESLNNSRVIAAKKISKRIINSDENSSRTIAAKKVTKRIVNTDGTVTRVIPSNSVKVINIK